jgi:hypothetical protein
VNPVTEAHTNTVLEEIASYEAIYLKHTDLFDNQHEADMAAAGVPLRNALFAYKQASEAAFAAARAVLPEIREAAPTHFEPAYRGQRMAEVAARARTRFKPLLEAWDRAIEGLVTTCAASAYPRLPEGADEGLLREEAEMLLARAGEGFRGLLALVRSERRDLAAVALGPWASSWASVNGLGAHDLAAVRREAIEVAKSLGTAAERGAANAYRDAFGLIGLRPAVQGALTAPTSLFADGRGLGFKGGYRAGAVDLMVWKDAGPLDFPPLTKMAV